MKHHKQHHQQSSNGESQLDPKKVEHRAYELYVEHGSIPGNDLQDWLWAERELKAPAQAAVSR
jgi:hypothetical protein